MTQLLESLKMAFAAIMANKLRASLTALGVVVGITFVLLMGWVLGGLDSALEDALAVMGDDILYVDKFEWGGGNWMEQRNRKSITYQQYLRARDRLRSPEYVVPTARKGNVEFRHGDLRLTGMSVMGTTSEYIDMLGGNVGEGRFFNEYEELGAGHLVILGSHIAENLFPDGDAIGRTVRMDGIPYTVVGTMPRRGSMMADFVDKVAFIPIKRYFGQWGRRGITINVKAGSRETLDEVREETIGVMRQVRSLEPGMKNDFGVNTQEAFRQQTDALRYTVWGVGLGMTLLSFLVGSIGIMNIMFVSVTERTKEIGIRKAVGATRSSVLLQFLIEAVLLTFFGAVVALVVTSGAVFAGSKALDVEFLDPTIEPVQILIAVTVSTIVGVVAGIIPAFRAARLDPVDALRAD